MASWAIVTMRGSLQCDGLARGVCFAAAVVATGLLVGTPCAAQPATARAPAATAPARSATSVHAGITFVEETVGAPSADSASERALPLIVLLHGLGDVPEQFIQVSRALPLRARVAAARGLTSFSQGYAWLPPSRPRDIDQRAQPVRRAVDRLEPAIAELAASHPTCGIPIVIGFSQGAMVTYGLAASPRPVVGAAFPIAGYLPPSLAPGRAPAGAPRIVALHGTIDPVVSFADDEASVTRLARAGYSIELRRYRDTEHTISFQMRAELGELVRAAAQAMGCLL